jgi:hypothetical protein
MGGGSYKRNIFLVFQPDLMKRIAVALSTIVGNGAACSALNLGEACSKSMSRRQKYGLSIAKKRRRLLERCRERSLFVKINKQVHNVSRNEQHSREIRRLALRGHHVDDEERKENDRQIEYSEDGYLLEQFRSPFTSFAENGGDPHEKRKLNPEKRFRKWREHLV